MPPGLEVVETIQRRDSNKEDWTIIREHGAQRTQRSSVQGRWRRRSVCLSVCLKSVQRSIRPEDAGFVSLVEDFGFYPKICRALRSTLWRGQSRGVSLVVPRPAGKRLTAEGRGEVNRVKI